MICYMLGHSGSTLLSNASSSGAGKGGFLKLNNASSLSMHSFLQLPFVPVAFENLSAIWSESGF